MRPYPTKAEQTEDNSKRYLVMESDVYEIGNVANATAIIVATFMEEFHGMAGSDVSAKDMAKHLDYWRSAVNFMVNHLQERALGLRKHYTDDEAAA
jgi:hypothetical protein